MFSTTKKAIAILTLCLLTGFAYAQSPLSLDACVEKALQRNLQIKSADNERLQAIQKIRETGSGLYPQISAEAAYNYYIDVPVQVLPASAFGGPEGEFTAAQFGVPQSTYGKIEASQALFNAQLFIGLKAAKVGKELSALQVQQTKENVVYNVSATYYNLLTLYKQQDLLRGNIANLDTTVQSTRLLYENGLAKASDVSRLEINVKSLQKQLADLRISERQLLNTLKILTDTPPGEPLAIDTSLQVESALVRPISPDSTGPERRTDIQLLELQKQLETLNRKSIQATYMPTLVAFGSYTSTAYNTEFNLGERLNNTSYPTTLVGLRLSLPIFDGGQKAAKIRTSRLESENVQYQLRETRQQALSDIDNATEKYNINLETLALQEANVAQARTTLQEVQVQYQEGTADVTDLLNANDDLLKTQTDYLKALVDLRVAGLELRKALGTLLN